MTSAAMVFPADIVPDFAIDVTLAVARVELEVMTLETDKLLSRELVASAVLDEMMALTLALELEVANKLLELPIAGLSAGEGDELPPPPQPIRNSVARKSNVVIRGVVGDI